jgi:hypothetical protein
VDQAVNTIGQFHLIEVDEQPKRDIQQFHGSRVALCGWAESLSMPVSTTRFRPAFQRSSRVNPAFNHHEFRLRTNRSSTLNQNHS